MKKKVGIKSSFEFKIRFHVAAVSSLQIQYAHSSALETRAREFSTLFPDISKFTVLGNMPKQAHGGPSCS